MELIAYSSREALAGALAERLSADLADALAGQGRASLSVPGGTTPGPVFDLLAQAELDWARVAVMLNDERWVPEASPRSNTALLRARLLQGPAAKAHLVPLYAPTPEPETALARLSDEVAMHLPLSVLLLGMGEDMHTASLFPGADRLAEALSPEAPVLMALRAEAAGEPRITLTARVLQGAQATHVMVTGEAKRNALERAMSLPPEQAPIAAILPQAVVHWAA